MHTLLLAIALFRAPGFPTVDAPPISDQVLEQALAGLSVVSIDKLKEARLLVLPYGSAFPLDAWPEIREFVKHGGDLVVLGGAPFHQPVLRASDGGWRLGVRQPTFAHELLIGPGEAVKVTDNLRIAFPDRTWSLPINGARTVWELTLRCDHACHHCGSRAAKARDAELSTAAALAWIWFLVASHPEVEARLIDEVRDVLGNRLATADDLLTSMADDGVDVSVAFPFGWSDPGLAEECNSYVIQAMRDHPAQLVGLAAIQPRAGARALCDLHAPRRRADGQLQSPQSHSRRD